MNELRQHKRKDKIKWVFTGISFVLVFVMLIGMCLQLFGTGKQKPSEWFKKPDTEQTTPDSELPAVDESGNELSSGVTHAMPAAMAFRTAKSLADTPAAQAASDYASVTLTATIEPASASDKTVDWSVAWVNASSKWATDKTVTDYVTVTPQTDGALTATVQCLQPFGEQIRVIVTSRMNEEATASCTVDFCARAVGILFLTTPVKENALISNGATSISNAVTQTIEPMSATSKFLTSNNSKYLMSSSCNLTPISSACTMGNLSFLSSLKIEGRPTSTLATQLGAQGFTVSTDYNELALTVNDSKQYSVFNWYGLACGLGNPYVAAVAGGGTISERIDCVNKINSAINNNTGSYDFDVRITFSSFDLDLNRDMGTYTYYVKYKVNRSSSVFGVTGVSLSNNSVII